MDPERDNVPDYLDVIKRPMDLSTVQARLQANEYGDEEAFANDVRQIFTNVYTYWKQGDELWGAAEKMERMFEEKFAQMNKWLGKLDGEEGG